MAHTNGMFKCLSLKQRSLGYSVQEENGPLALNGDIPTNLYEALILVVFGVELLLKNF